MGEAFITRRGGGGVGGLNFRVIGGTPAPSNPKENDIWVNTDIKITGWAFSADESPFSDRSELQYSAVTSSRYINDMGTEMSNSYYKITDYIELPVNTRRISVTMPSAPNTTVYHAFYNASKNLISTVQAGVGTIEYDVPTNTKYIRVSIYNNYMPTLVAIVDKITISDGFVWISTGTASAIEINALKKNGIQVYPLSAKQYISGAWVDVEAKSYQNGEWVEWLMYLYNSGNEYTDITGGFYYEAKRPQSNQNNGGTASLKKNQSNMILTQTSTAGAFGSAICATNKKIDLADVKNIVCDYSDVKVHHAYLCVWSAIGTYTTDNIVAKATILENGGEISEGKTSLDTTALSGEYVVGLYIQSAYSNTSTITINNIYCERG